MIKYQIMDYRKYVGIEEGLKFANKYYISLDKYQADMNRKITEGVIAKLIKMMQRESPAFKYLYVDMFGGGSCYDGLKISNPDEFDIDILMQLPEVTKPCLLENNIPGYVNLQLTNFQLLQLENPSLYKSVYTNGPDITCQKEIAIGNREMQTFVDDKNYLLTKEMKGSFMQSIFDRTVKNHFPNNIIVVEGKEYKIRMQSLGPAFTLTVERTGFCVMVDLVPCILLDGSHWPGEAFKPNPYDDPDDFFLVPKSPKKNMPHIERYWRLSFQKQERDILFDRQWLKPTIRILKRLRDCFKHKVSSYAIKTMFLRKMELDNPDLDDNTPEMWLRPWSYCVIYMLEVYVEYLRDRNIPYFWNKKLNLLDNLTEPQIDQYRRDMENILQDLKDEPVFENIIKFLEGIQK